MTNERHLEDLTVSQENGRTEYTAPTLLSLCTHYVAINICLVDSLTDFPELVGKLLFDAVQATGILDQPSQLGAKTLQLFSEAYQEAIMNELDFKGVHQLIVPHLELWQNFAYLKKLNMMGCKLGDDHDLLHVIAKLQNLKHLNLSDNALTDCGLQKLTTPLRVLHTGPRFLQELSLACNPGIGDGCVRYLLCWQLHMLDLSGTAFTSVGIKKLETATKLQLLQTSSKDFSASMSSVANNGWASEVVNKWIQDAARQPPPAKMLAEKAHAQDRIGRFYGGLWRKADAASKVAGTQKPPALPRLHLHARLNKDAEPAPQSVHSVCRKGEWSAGKNTADAYTGALRFHGKRRLRLTSDQVLDLVTQKPNKVIQKDLKSTESSHTGTEAMHFISEEDLLNSYRSCQEAGQRSPDSLWDAMNSQKW